MKVYVLFYQSCMNINILYTSVMKYSLLFVDKISKHLFVINTCILHKDPNILRIIRITLPFCICFIMLLMCSCDSI